MIVKDPISELWACVNSDGEIIWSRGGSSTTSRPMTYVSRAKAVAALNNRWIKQVHDVSKINVVLIYKAGS